MIWQVASSLLLQLLKAKALSYRMPKSKSRLPDIQLMWDILVCKSAQCEEFLFKLIDSNESVFVHSTGSRDRFWGTGLVSTVVVDDITQIKGQNIFGKLLCDLRSVLMNRIDSFCIDKYDTLSDIPFRVTNSRSIVRGVSSVRLPVTNARASVQAPMYRRNVVHRCFHCGVPGHVKRVCRLKKHPVRCYKCGEVGHKSKFCSNVVTVLPPINLCSNSCVNVSSLFVSACSFIPSFSLPPPAVPASSGVPTQNNRRLSLAPMGYVNTMPPTAPTRRSF